MQSACFFLIVVLLAILNLVELEKPILIRGLPISQIEQEIQDAIQDVEKWQVFELILELASPGDLPIWTWEWYCHRFYGKNIIGH